MQNPTLEASGANGTPRAAAPAYRVEVRGLTIACDTVEQVIEVVQRMDRFVDREVPLPAPISEPVVFEVPNANALATAVYGLFREDYRWRRPVEILKALKRKKMKDATYNRVYAVLRYGDFKQRDGKWNLKDAG